MEPNEARWYAKGWTACMDAIGLMLDDMQHQVAQAVIIAPDDWPPPQPGTHESELNVLWPWEAVGSSPDHYWPEYGRAGQWSSRNNPNSRGA